MLNIQSKILKAALLSAAKKDIRYYLNGVCLSVTASGNVFIMSTDGHRAFVAKVPANCWNGEMQQKGPFDIIIPTETVAAALKTKTPLITLSAMDNGMYSLANVIFAPVDGKFPDINKVLPALPVTDAIAQFNADYLADAQAALRIVDDSKCAFYALRHNGPSCAYMSCENAFVIIMSVRDNATQDHGIFKVE